VNTQPDVAYHREEKKMPKHKIAVVLAAGALAAGLGVASAFADNPPTPTTPSIVDQQSAANDVADAADDVQAETDNEGPDDQAGDQQGPNDQSEEQGDSQSGDQNGD
jgi:cytoskeletal protein RodZ